MLSGCTLILWSFYPKHVFKAIYNIVWGIPKSICLGFVRCLGFGRKGVGQSKAFFFFRLQFSSLLSIIHDFLYIKDTYASRYQSRYYKDYIPEDSLFASYQSYGAIGDDHDYYFGPADADTRQEKLGLLWQAFSWALFIRGIKLVMKRSAT